MDNSNKIILDLCGGTGAWSKPYRDNGYTVINVTLPEYDVRTYMPPENVYGILAAPPCTHFCQGCAHLWKIKDKEKPELLIEAISIVDACLRIVYFCKPKFWALENPVGRLKKWLGKPQWNFQPYEYGEYYTKRTYLWGNFTPPIFGKQVIPIKQKHGSFNALGRSPEKRSITPPGFAKAFMEANQ